MDIQKLVGNTLKHVNVLLGVRSITRVADWDRTEPAELFGERFQVALFAGKIELEREVVQRQPTRNRFGLTLGEHFVAAAHREQLW